MPLKILIVGVYLVNILAVEILEDLLLITDWKEDTRVSGVTDFYNEVTFLIGKFGGLRYLTLFHARVYDTLALVDNTWGTLKARRLDQKYKKFSH